MLTVALTPGEGTGDGRVGTAEEQADRPSGSIKRVGVGRATRSPKDRPMPSSAMAADVFPVPVVMDDGDFFVVQVPRMTQQEFEFFKAQLETCQSAIVVASPPQADSADD